MDTSGQPRPTTREIRNTFHYKYSALQIHHGTRQKWTPPLQRAATEKGGSLRSDPCVIADDCIE